MFPMIIKNKEYEFGTDPKPKKVKKPKIPQTVKPKKPFFANIRDTFKPKPNVARNVGSGGLLPITRAIDDETPPVRSILPQVQGQKPQSWFAKLLDFGLSQQAIKAQVQVAQAQAGVDQTTALNQVYQRNAQQFQNDPNYYSNSVGGQTGGALDGALNWVSDNILVVAGVGFGVYLLTRPSPIKGR
jgi:hypothetical protein